MKLKTSLRLLALLCLCSALLIFSLSVKSARQEQFTSSQKATIISDSHVTLVAQGEQQQSDKRGLKSYGVLRFNSEQISEQVRQGKKLTLQTAQQTFDLELEENNLLAAQYRAEEVTAGGRPRAVARPAVRTYKGKINNREDTAARLTITPQVFEGVLIADGEKYFIEPRQKEAAGGAQSEFIFYKESDVIERNPAICDVVLPERIDRAAQNVTAQNLKEIQSQALAENDGLLNRDIEIATEADYEFVTATGSSEAANANIISILNMVEETFQLQFGLSLTITYQHSWATADDPYQSAVSSTVLTEFRNYWNSNLATVNRDLAHMWTGKELDGNTIGVAYIGVACRSLNASYGVSQFISYDIDAMIGITAHEIGHNLGASHPDDQQPPATGCDNSIMLKNVGYSRSFCQFSLDQIKSYVGANANCLQQTFAISGQVIGITDGSNSNVSLIGPVTAHATIFQDGKFSFRGLLPGTYTLTPTHNFSQYAYTPGAQTVTVSNSSISDVNFTASPVTFNATGRVTDAYGNGLGNLNVEADTPSAATVTVKTNGDGTYVIGNLPVTRNYTIRASSDWANFVPSFHYVISINRVSSGLDFVATHFPAPEWVQNSSFTLITDGASERALALDSVTRTREPFSVINNRNFVIDRRTRVALYALNLSLLPGEDFSSAVTCQLEDAQGQVMAAPIEHLSTAPPFPWLTQVIVRLPDEAAGRGELRVRLGLRGALSNQAMINVR